MTLSVKEIQKIKKYFSDQPVLKAFLFGSYARNEADNESDVDILVDLDYSQHIGLHFFQMKFDLEEALHKPVDLVSSNGLSKHIAPFIENDMRLIYER